MSNYTLVTELKVQYLDQISKADHDIEKWIFLFGGKKLNEQIPLYAVPHLKSNTVIIGMLIQ